MSRQNRANWAHGLLKPPISLYEAPLWAHHTQGEGARAVLIGRSEEVAALNEAFRISRDGAGAEVIVAGEAGIGKTHLVRNFTSGLADAHLLWGSCPPLADEAVPYAAIRGAFRNFLRGLRDDRLRVAIDSLPHLAQLLPGRHKILSTLDPRETQALLLDEAIDAFTRLTIDRPVVLVIDDLHWADSSTLLMLTHLTHSLVADRFLLVTTFRVDDVTPRSGLGSWLGEHKRLVQSRYLPLRRLTRDEAAQQIRHLLGEMTTDDLVDAVYTRSQGNPFFTEEIAAAPVESGEAIPGSVEGMLKNRFNSLLPTSRDVLNAAAVGGPSIDPSLLKQVLAAEEKDVAAHLQRGVEAGLLWIDEAAGNLAFRHPLLREVAYLSQLPSTRRALHRAFGDALEASFTSAADPAVLAFHRWESGDHAATLAACLAACRAAQAEGALEAAHVHAERALDAWTHVDDAEITSGIEYRDLLVEVAEIAHIAGHDDLSVLHLETAIPLMEDRIDQALAYERLAWFHFQGSRFTHADPAIEKAMELTEGEESVPRARVLAIAALLNAMWSRMDRAEKLGARALVLARKLGARREEGLACNPLGMVVAARGEHDQALSYMASAVELALAAGEPDDIGRAYSNLAWTYFLAGRPKEAVDIGRKAWSEVSERGLQRTYGVIILGNLVESLIETGDWAEARNVVEVGRRHVMREGFDAGAFWMTSAGLAARQGHFEEAHARLDLAREIFADAHPEVTRLVQEVEFELALAEGKPGDLIESIREMPRRLPSTDDHAFSAFLIALAMRACAEIAEDARARQDQEDEDEAKGLAAALFTSLKEMHRYPLDPKTAGNNVAGLWGLQVKAEFERCHGHYDADIWAEAAAEWQRQERLYRSAYCVMRQVEAGLFSGGRASVAAEPLREAYGIARALGAAPLEENLRSLARPSGVDLTPSSAPDRAMGGLPHGLTQREAEVLGYLGAGLSNREIAERLFISAKTASVHVSNILRKLDARSRAHAAAIAERLDLSRS